MFEVRPIQEVGEDIWSKAHTYKVILNQEKITENNLVVLANQFSVKSHFDDLPLSDVQINDSGSWENSGQDDNDLSSDGFMARWRPPQPSHQFGNLPFILRQGKKTPGEMLHFRSLITVEF